MVDRRSYEQILEQLSALSEWLVSIGVAQKFDRMRVHTTNIGRLIEARKAGRLRDLVGRVGQTQLLWSLVETVEFVDAWIALRELPADILRQKVQYALQGPITPFDESGVSSFGRNIMFELSLAGRLHGGGVPLQLLTNPDILCEINTMQLHIQCKRPLTEVKIPRAVSDARKQLASGISASRNGPARGLIAISLSRVLNPGNRLLVVDAEADIERKLVGEIGTVRERYAHVEDRALEDQIIGFIYHLISPAFVEDLGLLIVADEMLLVPLAQASRKDQRILHGLASLMQ